MALDLKNLSFKDLFKKKGADVPAVMTGQTGKYEINLVPDVKAQMVKLQHTRNIVFFVCLVVGGAAVGLVAILGGIKGGQDIAMSNQDSRLAKLSSQIQNYDELSEFLTIQDQLGKIAEINDNKKVLSRVFNILTVLLPSGDDKITISELNVDLAGSVLSFDGQADAGVPPLIDYRVLESFKKSVGLMTYDYGRYVDEAGNEIPTRCIEETDENGNTYNENGSVYAIWKRGKRGCDPQRDDYVVEEESTEDTTSEGAENKTSENENSENTEASEGETDEAKKEEIPDERIWRTPQFDEWYKKNLMTTDGQINEVPHFESKCFTYTGMENGETVKWAAENSCTLAKADPVIKDSSNGRDSSGGLVLRFSAVLELNDDVFAFNNKHVMAIGPFGQNVTDSYRQVEGMFAERAQDCAAGDAGCSNTSNMGTGE